MKNSCLIFGCQNFSNGTCHGCLKKLDAELSSPPFAPGAIEHSKPMQSSAMACAKAFLRVVRNIAIVLCLILFAYLAWYWPEIWVDAQAKHAQNMLDATTAKCSKEVHL